MNVPAVSAAVAVSLLLGAPSSAQGVAAEPVPPGKNLFMVYPPVDRSSEDPERQRRHAVAKQILAVAVDACVAQLAMPPLPTRAGEDVTPPLDVATVAHRADELERDHKVLAAVDSSTRTCTGHALIKAFALDGVPPALGSIRHALQVLTEVEKRIREGRTIVEPNVKETYRRFYGPAEGWFSTNR